jgi:hypothetical protein
MRLRSSRLNIFRQLFPAVLLVTASCGDFQDSASGSQGTDLTHPSTSLAYQQQIDELGTLENRPRAKSVTFLWEPSPSGNATGYKVYITAVDDSTEPLYGEHVYDVSSETQLVAILLTGKKYKFTVTAYNAWGESLPADDFYFDLF